MPPLYFHSDGFGIGERLASDLDIYRQGLIPYFDGQTG